MALSHQLRSVIQLIDDLKDCGIDSKISLPRITVIGTQSSGKSSLLESIVGYNFLPRGEGTVTRRPLELRLVHVEDELFRTYAVFSSEDKKSKEAQIFDFDLVRKRIEEKTNEVAGAKRNIVDDPIILTIYSYECPNLTLVDLPGITRVPMRGSDQPEDIERITTEMTERYIQDDMTIILCVIAANSDISTSDALKLARKYDKKGDRTLGVLTKVDIMDRGTTALSILKNEVIQLQHGYVAVKNRSQDDINKQIKVAEALENEKRYFESHNEYRTLPNHVGTTTLSRKLTALLYEHITTCLPTIERDIIENLRRYEKELMQLGEPFPIDKNQKFFYLIKKAKDVGSMLKDVMECKVSLKEKNNSLGFQGFANFNLLVSKFQKDKNNIFIDGLKKTSPSHVILDIVEFKGISLPGFLPKEILEQKVQAELEKLKSPISIFIEDVKKHNEKLLRSIFDSMGSISTEVKDLLLGKSLEYLESLSADTNHFIHRLIEFEKDMIWTSDTSYFLRYDVKPSIQNSYVVNSTYFIIIK